MHKKTKIHQLDPRSKFMMICSFGILAFLWDNIILLSLLLICTIPFILSTHASKQIFQGIQGLTTIMLFILIVNSYFISVNFALIINLRVMILVIILSIYFQTTVPEDITQSLIKMHFPYSLAFSLSLSFRFIPTMANEALIVTDAQKSRGHRIEKGGIFTQIKNFFPILIPLLLNSIRRAFHVAEALETRGFGINTTPNYYHEVKLKLFDWFFIVCNLLFIIIGIILKIYLTILPDFLQYHLPF